MGNAVVYFFIDTWLYIILAIGILLCVKFVRNRKKMDDLTKAVCLATIILILHVWEEWVIPGGFHYFYNIMHGSAFPE